jgi:hypothetical protein
VIIVYDTPNLNYPFKIIVFRCPYCVLSLYFLVIHCFIGYKKFEGYLVLNEMRERLCVCVCVCVRACMRACACVCVCEGARAHAHVVKWKGLRSSGHTALILLHLPGETEKNHK